MTEAPPDATEPAAYRQHAATRLKAQVRLSAARVNALAIAVVGAAIIGPFVSMAFVTR